MKNTFYGDYNLLTKAQLGAGNKSGAIKAYQASIEANENKENEAYEALKKLLAQP